MAGLLVTHPLDPVPTSQYMGRKFCPAQLPLRRDENVVRSQLRINKVQQSRIRSCKHWENVKNIKNLNWIYVRRLRLEINSNLKG